MGFFKSLGNSITDGLKFDFKGSLGSFDEAFGSPLDKLGGGLKDSLGDAWKEITGEAAQERLMKLQNQYNVENWKMQNEYNTPAAQMLRYAEAGLNPNLIYGQSNLAGSVGSVSHGAVKSGMDMVGTVLSMLTGMQDLKNMKAQQSLTTQQAEFTKEQTRRYAHDTDWLINHNTSSMDASSTRGIRGVAEDIGTPVANTLGSWLGDMAGAVDNYGNNGRHVVINANALPHEDVVKRLAKKLSSEGYSVEIQRW